MELLVIMPSKYVGNTVISLRTLQALISSNGVAQTTLLIDANFEGLVKAALGDVKLITWPRSSRGQGFLAHCRRAIQFLIELRRSEYDEALDLDGTVLSCRITRWVKAARKTGPAFAKRTGVYDRTVPVDRDSQHCFDDYVQMSEVIGIPVPERDYLTIPPADPVPLPLPIDASKPLACIHPGATKDYKQWHIERFAALADWLIETGWQVVIVGAGQGEAARVTQMLESMIETPINAHDRLSLMELVRLCQASTLFIGNDSGPMHLAASSGTNVIALFGPTELIRWQPRSPQAIALKNSDRCAAECRPEDCKRDYACLHSLSVADVQACIEDACPRSP